MEDSTILDLYWQRDEAALTRTKECYGERLKRLAFAILKNNEDAEEIENDTYLKAWDSIPPQRPQYFFAYLAKICRNIALHKLDWKNASKRNAEFVEWTAELEQCIPDNAASFGLGVEEIGGVVTEFLRTLSKENRIIFIRRYVAAEPVRDIAQVLGVSESKIKSSLYRTRKKLRTYLEKEGIAL